MEKKFDWMVSGDCVEGCNSPPVCPGYWQSPFPKDLHNGKSECEGVWSFNIKEGYYQDINLGGLKVCYAFNSPTGYPEVASPWNCIIFIDSKADEKQAKALEEIYRNSWSRMGNVLKVKRGEISFTKELIGSGPAAKFDIEIKPAYRLKSEPLLTRKDGKPRYITSYYGGTIYIGSSEVNEFKDKDLPRTWGRPKMSTTYYEFTINPQKPLWMP